LEGKEEKDFLTPVTATDSFFGIPGEADEDRGAAIEVSTGAALRG